MLFVRRVVSELARDDPDSRWFVGNARLVGPADRGPDDAPFRTTIIQVGAQTVSLWNPDEPSHPFLAFPIRALDVQVADSKLPRLRLTVPFTPGETYIAFFEESGLGIVAAKRLEEFARDVFRQGDRTGQAS
jgi:hypothetical protein